MKRTEHSASQPMEQKQTRVNTRHDHWTTENMLYRSTDSTQCLDKEHNLLESQSIKVYQAVQNYAWEIKPQFNKDVWVIQ